MTPLTPDSTLALIADDHMIIRSGLRMMMGKHLGCLQVEETDTVSGILQALKVYPVTHMILDLQLKDGNLIDSMSFLAREYPQIPVLVYSMGSEELFGPRMLQLGASGFLSKASNAEETIRALGLFFKGESYISNTLQGSLTKKKTPFDDPFKRLSKREMSVLIRLVKGSTVKGIAAELNIQVPTVATYKARVFEKLGVLNLMDLINTAELYNRVKY